jgi:aryl-alcohol dehydrogenase-like predicted oxidoreductase
MVSEVGLGCWQLGGDFGPVDEETAREILREADQANINFFDTADVYGGGKSEERIARFMQEQHSNALVATKVGRDGALFPNAYTREKVRANIEGSARRLSVDCIDLVQLHCVPREILKDGEICAWMDDFQQQGLIKAWGASVELIEDAKIALSYPGLTSLQIIFNIFRQNAIDELFPAARETDVGIIVRLPLASGVLSGKMTHQQQFDSSDHRNYNRNGEFFSQGETFSGVPFDLAVDLAEAIRNRVPEGMSMAQMAMRWILDYPEVSTVIAGASRPQQAIENAAVSSLAPLSPELHQQLAAFYRSRVEPAICVPV